MYAGFIDAIAYTYQLYAITWSLKNNFNIENNYPWLLLAISLLICSELTQC